MSDPTKINITSNYQMGGITAHTVNFGPQARQMNERLGEQLKQRIPTSSKVNVVSVLGDGEAFGFANQVLQWLKGNGYANAKGVDQAVYEQPVMGQNIVETADGFEVVIGTRQQ
jgi:hypothetical protein